MTPRSHNANLRPGGDRMPRYSHTSQAKPLLARWPVYAGQASTPTLPLPPASSAAALARLEAILFLATAPLTTRRLAKLAGLADATAARTLIGQLTQRYVGRGSGLAIEQVAGGYRMLTRGVLAPWVQKLHGSPTDLGLSPPALETMAIVAYRQPVVRAEIEAVRGVQCGELLRQLIERDFLRIVGRSTELGRPLQYGTTKRFLEAFGLSDIADLPPLGELPTIVGDTSQRTAAA